MDGLAADLGSPFYTQHFLLWDSVLHTAATEVSSDVDAQLFNSVS